MDGLSVVGHVALEPAHDRVVLEQVSQRLVVREVVDGNDFQICTLFEHCTVEAAADAAKTIDTNLDGHLMNPL